MIERPGDFTYAKQNGGVILTGKLSEDHADHLDILMLSNNRIPHLLPVRIQNHERNVMIEYELTGRKQLQDWLRIHPLTEENVLHFILHVTNILGQLRDFMLVENRCMLRPDMIFINEQLTDVHCLYWPDDGIMPDEIETARSLQQLCLSLTKHSSEMRYTRDLIHYCDDPMFTLHSLRKKLISWIDRYEAVSHSQIREGRRDYAARYERKWLTWLPFIRRTRPTSVYVSHVTDHYTIPLRKDGEAVSGAYLELRSDEGDVRKIEIGRTPFMIGRDSKAADWAIDDVRISRIHAEIQRKQSGYTIRDLGSSNGTYVNGEKLIPFADTPLQPQDQIDLAGYRCHLVLEQTERVI